MAPEDAVDRYLNERKADISESTLYNHSSMLKQFVEWCEAEDIGAVNDLDSFHISDFKMYRRDNDGINNVTLYTQMATLRVFLGWCESRDLVDELAEKMILPDRGDASRDTKIEHGEARDILAHLGKYDYASMRHALFALLWDAEFRIGSVMAMDVEDYHAGERYVEVHHRPETGSPLKNKERGAREVKLHDWVCEVLDDYLGDRRPDVDDDYGRRPLIATKYGRATRTTLRNRIRCLTRPCEYTGECPHGRDLDDCVATGYKYTARCPSTVPPHALRRSTITAWLNDGHSKELIGDRLNVSQKILDKHYDARSEGEKRELRREAFGMTG